MPRALTEEPIGTGANQQIGTVSAMVADESEGSRAEDRIRDVVITMLESGGTDAVNLQEVARRARVSLTTVYKHFETRDELIVAAVAHWMHTHVYQRLADAEPSEPIGRALIDHYRRIFEPWERSPRMAEAFVRARMSPAGDQLVDQGFAAAEPVARSFFDGADPEFAEDVMGILQNVMYGLFVRYAAGEIAVTEILPTLERTVRRVTRFSEPQEGIATSAAE